jgi:mono/diheme cytochrome c family protein
MSQRWVLLFLVVIGLVLLGLAAVACGGGGEVPPVPAATEEATGVLNGPDLLEARCTRCHNLDRVQAAGRTQDGWKETVERMRGKGAQLTDEEAGILVDYLAETYGP